MATIDERGNQPDPGSDARELDIAIGPARHIINGSAIVLIQLTVPHDTNPIQISIPLTPDGAKRLAARIVDAAGAVEDMQATAEAQRKAANN